MAVADRDLEVPSQRRAVLISKENVRLRPGQYLIKTPEIFNTTRDRRGNEVRTRVSYNGTAYGVKFENNVAIIDDESVREIREVMLDELEGDTDRLPPWFRDPEGSAAELARKLQSDFGYEVTPELPKLRRLTKQQIAASHGRDPEDEITIAQAKSDRPGRNSNVDQKAKRATPAAAVALPGVDDAGVEEGRDGMPAQPPEGEAARPARLAPVRQRVKDGRPGYNPKRRGRSHKKKEVVSG